MLMIHEWILQKSNGSMASRSAGDSKQNFELIRNFVEPFHCSRLSS